LLSENIEERAIDPKLKTNCLDHQVQLINPEYDLKSTSAKEFKQECKKQQLKWHPDKNSNPKKAQTVSSRINPASEEILEAKKRQST
jgi:curved DNA-binding protein CbpA